MKHQESYWTDRYIKGETGWDIGYIATPLKEYIDQLEDKTLKILIPGAGNSYEAEYLFNNGFTNVDVIDIAAPPLEALRKRVPNFPENQLRLGDFFKLQGQYDLILEQTFFCAIPPKRRTEYVDKMYSLLKTGGKLVGVLFDFPLTESGPPYGGSEAIYRQHFHNAFNIEILETAHNSIAPRADKELFIKLVKK